MNQAIRNFLHDLQAFSVFENYYTSIVRSGKTGVPTADEARRDMEQRQLTYLRLRGL